MAFPTTIDSFTTKVDNVDTIAASHINALQTAVVAIETVLGITHRYSLADDVATSFTPPNNIGVMLVYNRNDIGRAFGGIITYRATASNYCYAIAANNCVVSTGALTNGTGDGTDTVLNVNTHTDGKIYIKNRLGTTVLVGVILLGG